MGPFLYARRHARACLILGLIAGLTLPGLAETLKPWLPEMVAGLLFLSALRIGPRAALGSLKDLRRTLAVTLTYQLALPLLALAALLSLGLTGSALTLAVVLMLSAPPVTGSPNFTALMGHDPAPPMRILILGTAIFPLTVLPVLWLWPGLGDARDVIHAASRLLAVIAIAVITGFGLRRLIGGLDERRTQATDGASAILLGVVVIGLMAAVGPALRETPLTLALWLLAVLAINFGLQIAAWALLGDAGYAIQAGNRNIALFLVALPPETTDALLLFIGCYQIPMYLTPIVMARIYRKASHAERSES